VVLPIGKMAILPRPPGWQLVGVGIITADHFTVVPIAPGVPRKHVMHEPSVHIAGHAVSLRWICRAASVLERCRCFFFADVEMMSGLVPPSDEGGCGGAGPARGRPSWPGWRRGARRCFRVELSASCLPRRGEAGRAELSRGRECVSA
jgi:hypothetical protein